MPMSRIIWTLEFITDVDRPTLVNRPSSDEALDIIKDADFQEVFQLPPGNRHTSCPKNAIQHTWRRLFCRYTFRY